MIKVILKAGAVLGVSLALSGSVALAGTSNGTGEAVIDNTGPDSSNVIKVNNKNKCTVKNINKVSVANKTKQNAKSGNVKVKKNTGAGSAMSGTVANDSATSLALDVANPSAGDVCGCACDGAGLQGAMIGTTGPDSWNKIVVNNGSKVSVTNRNNVSVSNNVTQNAKSGNVSVVKNTDAGDAESGSAENVATSDFVIKVSNY